MAIEAAPVEHLVVSRDVPWGAYAALTRELGQRSRLRLAYSEGTLEIMSPSPAHEKLTRLIEGFMRVLGLAWGVPVEAFGSATFQVPQQEKAVEPDGCYYIQNASAIRGKAAIDLAVDPPPDIVVEIDLSRSRINKRPLYAALGVGEFWRHDGENLAAYELAGGAYVPIVRSKAFPTLPIAEIERFLRMAAITDQSAATEAWYAWLVANKSD